MSREVSVRVAGAGLLAAVSLLPACSDARGSNDGVVTLRIRHSRFLPATVEVRAGVPVRITLINEDPIDHEWIVGDEATHRRHAAGTEPVHSAVPTEVTVPALQTRRTEVVFTTRGTQRFVCHLPGHEQYGMVGRVVVS